MSDELPEGWAASTVGELSEPLVSGFASGQKDVEGGLRHLRMNNISQQCALDLSLVRTVPRDMKSEKLMLRAGDSLCCTTNSGKLVGKVALFDRDGEWAFSNHLTRVRPRQNVVDPRWLYFGLRKLWTENAYEEFIKNWVNQAALPKEALAGSELPVPPLSEQRRIVGQVEALLEQVNRAKGRLDRVPLILKRFRQAVLATACSGELTREWRERHVDGGSAARLLAELFVQRRREHERAASAARAAGGRKPTAPKNLELAKVPDGLPDLPSGWAWVLFDDVCDDITVGHVGPMANEYVERGVPFLRSQNVRPFRFEPQGLKYITPAFHQRLAKSALRPGDIAVVRSGNAGEACVIPKQLPDSNCADLVVMRPSQVLDPYFAAIFINSSAARAHIEDVKVGIAQGHYNIGSARETPVPLPPLAEQAEIVLQVKKLFALADTIERRVQAATSRADKLSQAILSKAFCGELVPTEADLARAEGRTYETAEELLARVRAQDDEGQSTSRPREQGRRRDGTT